MDVETLEKGILILKIKENIESLLDFVSKINDNDTNGYGLKAIELSTNRNHGERKYINFTDPLTHGLSKHDFPDEIAPAHDIIRQSMEAACMIIESGLKKANDRIEKVFYELKPKVQIIDSDFIEK